MEPVGHHHQLVVGLEARDPETVQIEPLAVVQLGEQPRGNRERAQRANPWRSALVELMAEGLMEIGEAVGAESPGKQAAGERRGMRSPEATIDLERAASEPARSIVRQEREPIVERAGSSGGLERGDRHGGHASEVNTAFVGSRRPSPLLLALWPLRPPDVSCVAPRTPPVGRGALSPSAAIGSNA